MGDRSGFAWEPMEEYNHIDTLVNQKLERVKTLPSELCTDEEFLRRVSLDLTGTLPTPAEVTAFLSDPSVDKRARKIEELLARPAYGERWGRHWMDWVRYAESHGSEGDPPIDNAWFYCDYLIRALNDDVPFDQLVREHIAGDLLENPRINNELGINESAIGPAHLRMVFHGFAPTDALDEYVRLIVDVIYCFL
jgi:hypothetical protein